MISNTVVYNAPISLSTSREHFRMSAGLNNYLHKSTKNYLPHFPHSFPVKTVSRGIKHWVTTLTVKKYTWGSS